MNLPRPIASAMILALAACGDPANVPNLRFDFSDSFAQIPDDLPLPLNVIGLRLTDRSGVTEVELSRDDPTFEESVDPGEILIEATGRRTDSAPARATYFGDLVAIVDPLGESTVSVVMFAAGTAAVTVIIPPGVALPDAVRVRFTYEASPFEPPEVFSDPPNGQSTDFLTELREGTLERILPVGRYSFFAEAAFDGARFERFGLTYELVVGHGEISEQSIVF